MEEYVRTNSIHAEMIHASPQSPSTATRIQLSPLRYPGGKAPLYPLLAQIISASSIKDATYAEPFAGGAGAALALLVTGSVRQIVINDLDPSIFAFWYSLTNHNERFLLEIDRCQISVDEWKRQKDIYRSASSDDLFELGFAVFYLNRTNRSGVLNAGPIGGMLQNGNYKIDARFNKKTLRERIQLIGKYSRRIVVLNRDGIDLVDELCRIPNSFVYADPPYYNKSSTLYLNHFTDTHHAELADRLNDNAERNWLVTYDDVATIRTLYASRRQSTIEVGYSGYRRVKAQELIAFSDSLVIQ